MQGTVVTAGRARAVAIGTGQNTAIGQIRQAHCSTVLPQSMETLANLRLAAPLSCLTREWSHQTVHCPALLHGSGW